MARVAVLDVEKTKTGIIAGSDTTAKAAALIAGVVAALRDIQYANGGALQNEIATLVNQLNAASSSLSNSVAGK